MDKGRLHHYWTLIRPIRVRYFLLSAILFGGVGLYSLRQNNIRALQLRDAVLAADKENADVEKALRELRSYVYAHMNTNLASGSNAIKPPIQLKYRYERLVQAEKDRVAAANAAIYDQAQAECERKFPQGQLNVGRVECIQGIIAKKGVAAQPVPEGLYKFDFISPRWSSDLAGWSLLLATVFGVAGIGRWVAERWFISRLE